MLLLQPFQLVLVPFTQLLHLLSLFLVLDPRVRHLLQKVLVFLCLFLKCVLQRPLLRLQVSDDLLVLADLGLMAARQLIHLGNVGGGRLPSLGFLLLGNF